MGLSTYFLALGVTIAVEIPLLLVCTPSRDRARVWQIALLLNLFTHPLANLAYWEGLAPLLIIEVGVVVVEALGYFLLTPLSLRRSLALAALANLITGLGSLLLF